METGGIRSMNPRTSTLWLSRREVYQTGVGDARGDSGKLSTAWGYLARMISLRYIYVFVLVFVFISLASLCEVFVSKMD